MKLLEKIKTSPQWANFPFDEHNIIHLFEGGSVLHGARLEGKSDLDVYGIFIEPSEVALGIDKFEHFITSTSDETERNTAEDVDITLYSLRRWVYLAAKGNPTALTFLFAPYTRALWWSFREDIRKAVVCKLAARQFIGFVDGQMGRLLGTKGAGKHGQRPELIENFGYDTKAAMHAVRLMGEAAELMRTGYITFPRPQEERQTLIDVRLGKYSLDKISCFVSALRQVLDYEIEQSFLPERADRTALNTLVSKMYLEHWGLTS